VFTTHAWASHARQAFAAGAHGYVTKSSEPAVLLQALRKVAAGRRCASADVAQRIALETCSGDHSLASLIVREFELLRLLLAGCDVEAISADLKLSQKTVRYPHHLAHAPARHAR
jgi:DNA-binding NarL/FixJ family response regulator